MTNWRTYFSVGILTSLAGAMLFLTIGAAASAAGFDIRKLDLRSYVYPGSSVTREVQEQYDANLTMYSHDPQPKVTLFYKEKGLSVDTASPGDRISLKTSVAPHVPLKVVISAKPEREALNDRALYQNLEASVALGRKKAADLEQVRRRFTSLKSRFYTEDPRAILKECRQSGSAASAQKMMTAEERGRHLQELAMQGRFEELRQATEAFNSANADMAAETLSSQWDKEIMCLEELEKQSYPLQIEVSATRDDVLG